MQWSYAFSYGKNNSIDFSEHSLVQLIGKNGHGKSSIALILEEVLFNTNSKKIKKADVLNRYAGVSAYSILLEFTKDSDKYTIFTNRGSTQSVKLTKNGQDISAHTSTATYKLIEEILGFDHKSFTQIVYQSSAHSLEFLTATDTNRKKFLIDLLNLSIYSKYGESVKATTKELSLEIDSCSAKLSTVSSWLAKFSSQDLSKRELRDLPEPLGDELSKINHLKEQIANIDANNKKIAQNNKYKEILASIDLTTVPQPTGDLVVAKAALVNAQNEVAKYTRIIKGTGPILDKCTSCGQPIDSSHTKHIVAEAQASLKNMQLEVDLVKRVVYQLEQEYATYNKSIESQKEWEKYHTLINTTLPNDLYDIIALKTELTKLETVVQKYSANVLATNKYNVDVTAHNTKIDVILQQMDTMKVDFEKYSAEMTKLSKRLTNLQILVKTFGTSGLVAYKIECLVKDLENLTNEYLVDMSDGRFQISFKMNSSDKLNVIVTDNGYDIDIQALSKGEMARVNVATLLAIRKLMQSLSDSRINLLILDETVESLDADGKEKLIEVLLEEEYLNTILVSHGFSHPLLTKFSIVKEDDVSRIE
ncbi:MAG: chromosome segregation protein [Parcubacteria group bacterium ADurb.Bin216]|nr:MAG: chromosome segregation protein [Parcubacteria group bacterium ADurb.Bin216]